MKHRMIVNKFFWNAGVFDHFVREKVIPYEKTRFFALVTFIPGRVCGAEQTTPGFNTYCQTGHLVA